MLEEKRTPRKKNRETKRSRTRGWQVDRLTRTDRLKEEEEGEGSVVIVIAIVRVVLVVRARKKSRRVVARERSVYRVQGRE